MRKKDAVQHWKDMFVNINLLEAKAFVFERSIKHIDIDIIKHNARILSGLVGATRVIMVKRKAEILKHLTTGGK